MPDALLRPLIYLLIAAGLFGSGWLTGCNYGSRELTKFKVDADALLEKTKAQNTIKEARDAKIAQDSSDKYNSDILELRTKLAVALKSPRLRDPGARPTPPAQACTNTGTVKTEASTTDIPARPTDVQQPVELSKEFSDFLITQASKADELAVWANSCWKFVNKDQPQP